MEQHRQPMNPSAPSTGVFWSSLPQYLEKPALVAAVSQVARLPSRSVHEGARLCVGHLNLHPSSLADPSHRQGQDRTLDDPCSLGCLARVSLCSLIGIQFYLPGLQEALWLLEGIARGSFHSLRKIVDKQSRWRLRVQHLENLDEAWKARAASLADDLGTSLRSLRHLEGPVFSLLLRVRAGLGAAPSAERCSLGGRAQTLHLMDIRAGDLLGIWEPVCPRLKKLMLLNLPAVFPGRTVTAVAEFLSKVPNLTELQLDFKFFDPVHWEIDKLEMLIERVQEPPSKISKLTLEWCRLGDAGVACVCGTLARTAHALASQTPPGGVTELSLAHCELRDIGSVCDMLETPGLPLTKLDLSSNHLDDEQALRLAKSLPLSKVKELRLRDSLISVPLPVKTEWFWRC
mmetsp:Transcript_34773/g.108158  ORF Transcript_34773/g.108158 Transcript_34773/m.108158 type:complete len:402 (+) Transcript_34773:58-1263(+)